MVLWIMAWLVAAAPATGASAAESAAATPARADSLPAAGEADTLAAGAGLDSPLALLAVFERAWRWGAGDSVLACLSSRSVELALHRAGPTGGRFQPTQAAYLIRDLLHYGVTQEFRVVRFEWKSDAQPRAEVEWVHRMAGYEMREVLEVALAREDRVWRVVRIANR